jgi:hypothetical protein
MSFGGKYITPIRSEDNFLLRFLSIFVSYAHFKEDSKPGPILDIVLAALVPPRVVNSFPSIISRLTFPGLRDRGAKASFLW